MLHYSVQLLVLLFVLFLLGELNYHLLLFLLEVSSEEPLTLLLLSCSHWNLLDHSPRVLRAGFTPSFAPKSIPISSAFCPTLSQILSSLSMLPVSQYKSHAVYCCSVSPGIFDVVNVGSLIVMHRCYRVLIILFISKVLVRGSWWSRARDRDGL